MAKKFSDLDRHITAHHEAAHAVMAFRFGIPVEVVAVCDEGPLYGYVRFARAPSILAGLNGARVSDSLPILVRDAERCVILLLAGPLAEAKLLGRPMRSHTCESDLQKSLALCELLRYDRSRLSKARRATIPEIESTAIANGLRRRTAQVLNRADVWRAVVAVAEDLKAWSQLTGPDAADTAQWTRRVRNQLRLLLPMPKRGSGIYDEGRGSRSPLTRTRLRTSAAALEILF